MSDHELRYPDCRLFIDAEISESELIGMLRALLFTPDAPARPEAEIARNPDYDSKRRAVFPEGFLYFRYTADLYFDSTDVNTHAALVGRVLRGVWDMAIPCVAACGFEALLPEHGGYKSRAVPWSEPQD